MEKKPSRSNKCDKVKLMMVFLRVLWRIEIRSLLALFICSCLMGLYGLFDSFRASSAGLSTVLSPVNAAWTLFAYTMTIGVLPVILYGAPVYAFLFAKRLASWYVVMPFAAAPGLALCFILPKDDRGLGIWSLTCGIIISALMHLMKPRESA